MIQLTTALLLGFSGSSGVIIGCLVRQPEINRLRKMVKQLNDANSSLRKIIEEQMQLIDHLQDEIRTYKFYNWNKRRVTRIELRKNLTAQYAVKEYCEMLIWRNKHRKEKLDDIQQRFFDIMDGYINGEAIQSEDQAYMEEYVIKKYKENIRKCEKWDYHQLIDKAV